MYFFLSLSFSLYMCLSLYKDIMSLCMYIYFGQNLKVVLCFVETANHSELLIAFRNRLYFYSLFLSLFVSRLLSTKASANVCTFNCKYDFSCCRSETKICNALIFYLTFILIYSAVIGEMMKTQSVHYTRDLCN